MKVKIKKVENRSDSLINEFDIESASLDNNSAETVNDVPAKKSGIFPFVLFIILGLIALSICFGSENATKPAPVSNVPQIVELQPPTEYGAKKLAQQAIKDYLLSEKVDPRSWGFLIDGEKMYYHDDDNTWSYNGLIMHSDNSKGTVKTPFTAAIAVDIDKEKNEYVVDLFYFMVNNRELVRKRNMLDSSGLYHRDGVSDSKSEPPSPIETSNVPEGWVVYKASLEEQTAAVYNGLAVYHNGQYYADPEHIKERIIEVYDIVEPYQNNKIN